MFLQSFPVKFCVFALAFAKDVQRALAMNMMYRGFMTDPNTPGSEKLVLASVNEKWLKEPRARISCADFDADPALLPPQVAFAAKGWNRSIAAWMVLCAAWELGEELVKARWLFVVDQESASIFVINESI